MKVMEGDLIELAKDNHFDVIVQGCNCHCTMNSGIAKQIREQYPQAYAADLTTEKGDKSKLGSYSQCMADRPDGTSFLIINAYTQHRYGYDGERYLNYGAIVEAFTQISINHRMDRIGYPAIGCGLAGGDWSIVSELIDTCLYGMDHTFVSFKR